MTDDDNLDDTHIPTTPTDPQIQADAETSDEVEREQAKTPTLRAQHLQADLKESYKTEIESLKEDKTDLKKNADWLRNQIDTKNALLNQEELGRLKEKNNSKKHANILLLALIGLLPAVGAIAILYFGDKYGKPASVICHVVTIIIALSLIFFQTRK